MIVLMLAMYDICLSFLGQGQDRQADRHVVVELEVPIIIGAKPVV